MLVPTLATYGRLDATLMALCCVAIAASLVSVIARLVTQAGTPAEKATNLKFAAPALAVVCAVCICGLAMAAFVHKADTKTAATIGAASLVFT